MSETAEDQIARIAAGVLATAAEELATALQSASPEILLRIATDIGPLLFRDYTAQPYAEGGQWGDALVRPDNVRLPSFLVRVHAGPFTEDDFTQLRESMASAGVSQAALAVVALPPFSDGVRRAFGPLVPWLLDRDGLVRMMLANNVGVTLRVHETKYVNSAYFR